GEATTILTPGACPQRYQVKTGHAQFLLASVGKSHKAPDGQSRRPDWLANNLYMIYIFVQVFVMGCRKSDPPRKADFMA
ncbi:hypothetical protein, partial [Pseudomonas corrugata]|uniref:hypothetical protein n=2 Tax=Pseudomonas corrugata TaxID=47879 RepID=UPI0019D6FE4E